MNHNRKNKYTISYITFYLYFTEFRRYLHENIPFALDYYYQAGELLDSTNKTRQLDLEVWEKLGPKQN